MVGSQGGGEGDVVPVRMENIFLKINAQNTVFWHIPLQ